MNSKLKNSFLTESDTKSLSFSTTYQPIEYGNGRRAVGWRVLMSQRGRVVGAACEAESKTLLQAERDAEKSIAKLQRQRLFVISVTAQHISRSEARNCHACAIYHALRDHRERILNLNVEYPYDRDFKVNPYGFFTDSEGIALYDGGDEIARIEPRRLPPMVTLYMGGLSFEWMVEWAMMWDDWADSRYMSLKEWRERHSYTDGERPYKPSPCSFVLNVDEFAVQQFEEI